MRSVTVAGTRASATRDAIAALSEHGLDPAELLHEVEHRMRPVVPYDTGAWWTTDPETLLPTVFGVSEPPSRSGDVFSPADYGVFSRLDQTSRDTALDSCGDLYVIEPDYLHASTIATQRRALRRSGCG